MPMMHTYSFWGRCFPAMQPNLQVSAFDLDRVMIPMSSFTTVVYLVQSTWRLAGFKVCVGVEVQPASLAAWRLFRSIDWSPFWLSQTPTRGTYWITYNRLIPSRSHRWGNQCANHSPSASQFPVFTCHAWPMVALRPGLAGWALPCEVRCPRRMLPDIAYSPYNFSFCTSV